MYRIISTSRLTELEAHASALPMARAQCDRAEKDLEKEKARAADLTAALETANAQLANLRKHTAAEIELARSAAQRTRQQTNTLITEAQKRAKDIEFRADAKVRELRAEIEQLKAKLPDPLPDPQGVVARYENVVGADIDLTLYVTEDPAVTWRKRVDLLLVLLCTGCGYRKEETRDGVTDSPGARREFLNDPYDGAKLKRRAQEHAETCRAVTLQHTLASLRAIVPAT
ncbi:DivIVA domain-containing protein [Streptomyces bacillaris]|uniref:DivIVA domain-containing protein n=1 Tax=Streptomyces bacillaris TaxID=68179 RepID=UPI00345F3EFD